jgi:uncharacterized phiE125 gp8 family phage protein
MLSLVTPPTSEPIDLATAKQQCRVDLGDDDALIEGYITAARQLVEEITGRQLITATWDLILDGFSCCIDLPKPPLQSVVSVKYVDTAGVTQTVPTSNYKVIGAVGSAVNPAAPLAKIEQAYATYWPIARCESGNVTVRFTAGYGDATKVPLPIVQAQLLLIAHWYRNRESVVISPASVSTLPQAVDALLGPYRTFPVCS